MQPCCFTCVFHLRDVCISLMCPVLAVFPSTMLRVQRAWHMLHKHMPHLFELSSRCTRCICCHACVCWASVSSYKRPAGLQVFACTVTIRLMVRYAGLLSA